MSITSFCCFCSHQTLWYFVFIVEFEQAMRMLLVRKFQPNSAASVWKCRVVESGNIEAITRNCFRKKLSWKILQSLQENTCAEVFFFNKLAGCMPSDYSCIWKDTPAQWFPVNFAKLLNTPFCTSEQLLLKATPC